MKRSESKRFRGQFFTVTNPFRHDAFFEWWRKIPEEKKNIILEPFAGSNSIVEMIQELDISSAWKCCDIEPVPSEENKVKEWTIERRDTIRDFPTGCSVAITNPPYLAKNSATRMKMPFPYPDFDDLYKKCIDVMLLNCDYVAAIIPESFITAGIYHDRLETVISLPFRMFDDTECPVCLALFSPSEGSDDFIIYSGDEKVGSYKELTETCERILHTETEMKWTMNAVDGQIGVCCVDNTENGLGIAFTDDFKDWKVSPSNRSYTVVGGLPDGIEPKAVIEKANRILEAYRSATKDVFMTSFKGLRKDGRYRRRLDFKTVQRILSKATV